MKKSIIGGMALLVAGSVDEIQNVPELFSYIRSLIDASPDQFGNWLLTGSQEAPLMKGVTESMAGRAAVFQLHPFATEELDRGDVSRRDSGG